MHRLTGYITWYIASMALMYKLVMLLRGPFHLRVTRINFSNMGCSINYDEGPIHLVVLWVSTIDRGVSPYGLCIRLIQDVDHHTLSRRGVRHNVCQKLRPQIHPQVCTEGQQALAQPMACMWHPSTGLWRFKSMPWRLPSPYPAGHHDVTCHMAQTYTNHTGPVFIRQSATATSVCRYSVNLI